MIIPTEHEFECACDENDTLFIDVLSETEVYIVVGQTSISMRDREQVTMLRDMLTVWLSRP